jgi:hypothetical protein
MNVLHALWITTFAVAAAAPACGSTTNQTSTGDAGQGIGGGTDSSSTSGTSSSSGGIGTGSGSSGGSAGDAAVAPSDAGSTDANPYPLATLDTPCGSPTGPTGRQLLALIGSPYVGTYTPYTPRPSDYPSTAPTAPTALTIELTYTGKSPYCKLDDFVCCPGCPCRAPLPPSVTIDLDVAFKTADRVFDESFTATAVYPGSGASGAGWSSSLAGTAIRGTFPVALGTPAQVSLSFDATFNAAQQGGTVSEWGPATGGGQREFTAGSWMANGAVPSSDASKD